MAASQLSVRTADGVVLSGEQTAGEQPIVLLHGLTATRRYVVMGSRLLERSGHRVIAYDARGHGRSTPGPRTDAYGYDRLADDLGSVLDALDVPRALLAGASMGAHTALRFALAHPERVSALALITPSFDPDERDEQASLAGWDALARGMRAGGVEGFLDAYDFSRLPAAWRETVATVVRQRLAAHEHPEAVADALSAVPRSHPFAALSELERIGVPTVVIGSRDEADPGHPLAVAERYASTIAGARLHVEPAGPPPRSPLAWQGGQLSRVLAELAASAG
ncbi:MAG TPA: alpha/beta hydrolase [Solirubrobacteraceae bacterium]|nr:alpha/beta hydrolase [Solirubrobacteraceae bacterium]